MTLTHVRTDSSVLYVNLWSGSCVAYKLHKEKKVKSEEKICRKTETVISAFIIKTRLKH